MAKTIWYEVRTSGSEEGRFDEQEAAEAFFKGLDDGCLPIELVKITETLLKTRNVR